MSKAKGVTISIHGDIEYVIDTVQALAPVVKIKNNVFTVRRCKSGDVSASMEINGVYFEDIDDNGFEICGEKCRVKDYIIINKKTACRMPKSGAEAV